MIGEILEHLELLVACNTENPPRNISASDRIFAEIRGILGDQFDTQILDHGNGCVAIYAIRGNPQVLFNVHLDTVPASPEWKNDPFILERGPDQATGLGAADIKGAAACLMALARNEDCDLALLFSSDEEAGAARCVKNFIKSPEIKKYAFVAVAEPTGCRPVLSHRGFISAKGRFFGSGGHSSDPEALANSAVHKAIEWGHAALAATGEGGKLHDQCFNIGLITGGTAGNVVAPEAMLTWSARPTAGTPVSKIVDFLTKKLPGASDVDWQLSHEGPGLPPAKADSKIAANFADRLGLKVAEPVDFWTEASLFAAAGKPTFVLGPGHIKQAHTAGEWVSFNQLLAAYDIYSKIAKSEIGPGA